MSYFVCHGQKAKIGDIKNIERHIERKNQNYKNKDIDKTRTYMNYDLHNNRYASYKKRIDERIKESYTSNRAIRKDATMMVNFIISSDSAFFKKLSESKQKEYFRVSYEYLRDYFGAENVLSAKVHLDEITPHMHFSAIPLVDGKLNAKNLMNRNFLRKIQSELPKILQYHGFDIERGIEGSKREHKGTDQYKKEMESNILSMEKDVQSLTNIRDNLKFNLKRFRGDLDKLNDINRIYVRKTLLGANIVISENDYNMIESEMKNLIIENQELEEHSIDLRNNLKNKDLIINDLYETIRNIRFDLNKSFLEKENMYLSKMESLEKKIEMGYESEKIKLEEELRKEIEINFNIKINELLKTIQELKNEKEEYIEKYSEKSYENYDLKTEIKKLEFEKYSFKNQLEENNIVIENMSNEFKAEYLIKKKKFNKEQEIFRKIRKHEEWIKSNGARGEQLNLENEDLKGMKLIDLDLREANLKGADMTDCIIYADLRGANLMGIKINNSKWIGSNLSNVSIEENKFNSIFSQMQENKDFHLFSLKNLKTNNYLNSYTR